MITIRKAQANDVPAIWSLRKTAIYKGCAGFYPDETLKIWAEAAPTDAFKHKVERDCYLAMLDERMVGMGMLNQHSGQVDALFMDSEHMGQGIGKEILAYLENLARESGLKLLQLDASLNAVPFYRACGFSGEKASKYQSPTGVILDCMKLQKPLV